jgi:hypothetical protein
VPHARDDLLDRGGDRLRFGHTRILKLHPERPVASRMDM